jgi:hypothetical protein
MEPLVQTTPRGVEGKVYANCNDALVYHSFSYRHGYSTQGIATIFHNRLDVPPQRTILVVIVCGQLIVWKSARCELRCTPPLQFTHG